MAVYDHTRGKLSGAMGSTFSANPLTMAAGLATLAACDAPALTNMGDALRDGLNAAFAAAELPAQMTGHGELFRLHLTRETLRDYHSLSTSAEDRSRFAAIHASLPSRGILLTTNCSGALSTPMGKAEMALLSAALLSAVTTAQQPG